MMTKLTRLVVAALGVLSLAFVTGCCVGPLPSPTALSSPTSAPPTFVPTATAAVPTSTSEPAQGSPTPEPPTPQPRLTLTSSAFEHEGEMPLRFAQRTFDTPGGPTAYCPGENVSPPLNWSNVPPGTSSLVLTMYDHITRCETCGERAPEGRIWGHWGVYNIPAEVTGLSEGLPADSVLPDGSIQVVNGWGEVGYGGPCPPPDHVHFYVFTLYALDTQLDLPENASVDDLNAALDGHVLEKAELTGTFVGQ